MMVVVLKPRHFFLPANSLCVYAAEGGGALTFSLFEVVGGSESILKKPVPTRVLKFPPDFGKAGSTRKLRNCTVLLFVSTETATFLAVAIPRLVMDILNSRSFLSSDAS